MDPATTPPLSRLSILTVLLNGVSWLNYWHVVLPWKTGPFRDSSFAEDGNNDSEFLVFSMITRQVTLGDPGYFT